MQSKIAARDGINGGQIVPFVVERIERNREKDFRDVTDMTIQVFFNEDDVGAIAPWKAAQLSYLRHAQYSDLRMRKFMPSTAPQNDMFIARRVVAKSPATKSIFPFRDPSDQIFRVIDIEQENVFNKDHLPSLSGNHFYALGEVIGFCEVSEKFFSFGEVEDETLGSYRPVLTNLAVKANARKSGVGSTLVNECEVRVANKWSPTYGEIALQVEDDNQYALRFYEKLGYKVVYADPTTRRYDTSGFFLKQVRSTKISMRKFLGSNSPPQQNNNRFPGSKIFQAFREAVSR